MLDLSGRSAVIVGGGAVAARKARGLLEAGAALVRCVAPAFAAELPGEVQRVAEAYESRHLDGAFLVFAATDDARVNSAVVRDARARNLLVNRADVEDEEPGDFTVPASHWSGNVIVSVSAGSPALSAMIRDRIAGGLDRRWEMLAGIMREMRPRIVSSGLDIARRRQIFRDLASDAALQAVGDGGPEGLRRWLFDQYPELDHA